MSTNRKTAKAAAHKPPVPVKKRPGGATLRTPTAASVAAGGHPRPSSVPARRSVSGCPLYDAVVEELGYEPQPLVRPLTRPLWTRQS